MRLVKRLKIGVSVVGLLVGCTAQQNRSARTAGDSRPGCGKPTECQRAAKMAFDAEMARNGKDCLGVTTTTDENDCQVEALRATERNFAAFLDALEGLVGRSPVEASQQAWLNYRAKQCDAIFDFFTPGTIGPSARTRCKINLTRSRMRDLDELFESTLHH